MRPTHKASRVHIHAHSVVHYAPLVIPLYVQTLGTITPQLHMQSHPTTGVGGSASGG